MTTNTIKATESLTIPSTYRGFVRTSQGKIYVQLPDDNQFGFSLYSDDQCWPGGFGAGVTWVPVRPEDLGEAEQERCAELDWLLDE